MWETAWPRVGKRECKKEGDNVVGKRLKKGGRRGRGGGGI